MAPRKVLLLTYHFPPSGAVAVYRLLGLVRHLPSFGWQPVVVAPPRVPWEPEDLSLLNQVPAETPIERVPFAEGFASKVTRWMAPEAHWLCKARPACERMIRTHRPEAILTSSPPGCVHLLGCWLMRRHALPWIADFRDPWITNRRPVPFVLHDRIERWLEARVLGRATMLIANTPLNREGWAAVYPNAANKIVTIPNGFDPERFACRSDREVEPRGSSALTILHAGEFYYGRDPRPFLDALAMERLPVRVEFLGRQTETLCDLAAEIRSHGLDECVQMTGQVAYAAAIERMMGADILLLVHTPGYHIGVPAKLYEYLGAGRPILALAEPDSDIAWVLRESKVLHRIAPPTNASAIRAALVALIGEVQAGRPAAPDADAVRQFTRERMAQRVADCLDACTKPREAIGATP